MLRVSPVLSFFAVTFAPATNALLESRTVPLIRPASVCAVAAMGSAVTNSAVANPLKNLIVPPAPGL